MKKLLAFALMMTIAGFAFSQKVHIKGKVTDATTGEGLIGATVLYEKGKGVVTDFDGNYSMDLPVGEYTLTISYVGYIPQEKKINTQGKKNIALDFALETTTLQEVDIVADVAKTRETPVAFMNIKPATLEEELGERDLPMILNTTPGVYATQQGGGEGDATISIRGFDQRNVAVLIDGIPMNDMENGRVYWSNWFGLDAVTRSMQIQRGLGASKLAIPSVGGTVNILTKGIEAKKGGTIKQVIGNDGYLRTSVGLTTGRLKKGWGFTFAGSYKKTDGYIDNTYSNAWFYYLKVEKEIGHHTLSLSMMNGPQSHASRAYKKPIATYSHELASELGVPDSVLAITPEYGVKYNEHWGYLERFDINSNGDTIHASNDKFTEQLNRYQKPVFNLKHFWTINRNLFLSNIVYASFGTGGSTKKAAGTKNGAIGSTSSTFFTDSVTGLVDYQATYNINKFGAYNYNTALLPRNYQYSSGILAQDFNSHRWWGFLSTLNYKMNERINVSAGVDLRSYRGLHYREVYDLLGGDYFVDATNRNQSSPVKYIGDRIHWNYDGLVRWGGLFGQLEYKFNRWSTFLNLSVANTGYKRIDYFKKKDVVLGDDLIVPEAVGYGDILYYNGTDYIIYEDGDNQYSNGDMLYVIKNTSGGPDTLSISNPTEFHDVNSPDARYAQSKWKWVPGFTVKGGANYNINEDMNVFVNVGYLSKAPKFRNVFDWSENTFTSELKNEIVKAAEIGYSYATSKFAANVNGYYTRWENKPTDYAFSVTIDEERYSANINGMDAVHMGIEFDFIYKVLPNLDVEGIISIGDWRWKSEDTVYFYNDGGQLIGKQYFNATDVHVSDAAQSQFGLRLRYEPIKKLYITGNLTLFDRYYAFFDPLSLNGSPNSVDENGNPKDSWSIPSYYIVDAHAGYRFKFKKLHCKLGFSVLNVLDELYVANARNNDTYNTPAYTEFDAKSASVFLGLGRRYSVSFGIRF